jgi:hypothetical protein
MAARATIALCLATFGWAGAAWAQDNPACAQYHEAMAYNLCLSQQGPKANGVGQLHGGGPQPGGAARGQVRTGIATVRTPDARFTGPQSAQRIHGRVHIEFRVR